MADRQHDAGSKIEGAEVTEASRVQNMLNEQNAWIDRLKSQIMQLELDIVGYRVRNKQLEAALREIAYTEPEDKYWPGRIARKALEGKNE